MTASTTNSAVVIISWSWGTVCSSIEGRPNLYLSNWPIKLKVNKLLSIFVCWCIYMSKRLSHIWLCLFILLTWQTLNKICKYNFDRWLRCTENKKNESKQLILITLTCFVFFSYKTVVRPSYKVVYRTVTSLEWKCCPGFSGTGCGEGRRRLKEDFVLEYGHN